MILPLFYCINGFNADANSSKVLQPKLSRRCQGRQPVDNLTLINIML